jgi:hypothetical protein
MSNKKYVVFGTGMSAFSLLRSFSNLNILFFLDNNKERQYEFFHDKPILPPEILDTIKKGFFKIIIASEYYNEISSQLISYGYKSGEDFIPMKDLLIEKSDYFLISYMKCGRTWLRFIIGTLIEQKLNIFNDDKLIYTDCYQYASNDYPIITSYHDDNPHLKSADELNKLKTEYKGKKVIFLVRDPRDVAVSLFYHMKYRSNSYAGGIDDFVVGIIPSIINYFNIWYDNRNLLNGFTIIRYEDLHNNPLDEISSLNSFLNFGNVDINTLEKVINASSFVNMKTYEQQNKSENLQLNSKLLKNQNSAKVRKGKVGGYVDELSTEIQISLRNYIKENLNPIYEYEK